MQECSWCHKRSIRREINLFKSFPILIGVIDEADIWILVSHPEVTTLHGLLRVDMVMGMGRVVGGHIGIVKSLLLRLHVLVSCLIN